MQEVHYIKVFDLGEAYILRFFSAVICIGVAGWGLSVLAAPIYIWVGTALVMAYLFRTGKQGIFLASLWMTVLVGFSIALDLLPDFWPRNLHYRYWALCLMLLWGAAITATWLLGSYFSHQKLIRPKQRNVASILSCMTPQVRDALSEPQLVEVERLIDLALPKPTSKLVDLRIEIDFLVERFYLVLLVGKDRRKEKRHHAVSRLTRLNNWLTAIVLLIGFNVTFTIALVLFVYLLKSALGINLLPGHFRGFGT